MHSYESFSACLKRCLAEAGLSATEAAKLVGFRSRNSIFRILAGETRDDVNLRFLSALHDALGDAWPKERWLSLQEALSVERLGAERYEANRAFERLLHEREEPLKATVQQIVEAGGGGVRDLTWALDAAARAARAEIVITGCCDSALSLLLAERCCAAGDQGRLRIRQYIDTSESTLTQHILGILPLVSKPWYNARLVQPDACQQEMLALYRMHALHICCWDEQGNRSGGMLIRFDKTHFATQWRVDGAEAFMQVLDRLRFDLELLKPMPNLAGGPESFIQYTERYAQLEDNCTILSIKPDVHFNCIPPQVLYPAIEDFGVDFMIGEGPGARSIHMGLHRFTLVGATTRSGQLTAPLRDRFGILLRLEMYTPEELSRIVIRSAGILGIEIDDDGALEIASRSRGTPRIANRLLKRVRDVAQVRFDGKITLDVARAALERFEIDELGLDDFDRRLLNTMIVNYGGGPVGLDTLAAAVGEESVTIEDACEPYLMQIGFLTRTPRGRCVTALAYRHLGIPFEQSSSDGQLRF